MNPLAVPNAFCSKARAAHNLIHTMAQGDKSKYTGKQKRKAEHIEKGYEKRGVSKKEAEERAWRTVNAQDKGGKKPGGPGRGKKSSKSSSGKSGRKASAKKSSATKSSSRKTK